MAALSLIPSSRKQIGIRLRKIYKINLIFGVDHGGEDASARVDDKGSTPIKTGSGPSQTLLPVAD